MKAREELQTIELLDILKVKDSYQEVIGEVRPFLSNITLAEYLNQLIEFKRLKKTEIILHSRLERSYAYQIFAGKKIPSRDKLLALAFGMKLTYDEVQDLLKVNSYAQLYPQNSRDNIIIFALYKGQSILELNENLLVLGEAIFKGIPLSIIK